MGCAPALLLFAIACGGNDGQVIGPGPDPAPDPDPTNPTNPQAADIRLMPSTTYQTIVGWEAHNQAGQHDIPEFPQYSDKLLDMVVNDLGISRVRLEVRSGMENTVDIEAQNKAGLIDNDTYRCKRWEIVNDNANPNHIDPGGFHFSFIDETIEGVILPMQAKLAARGERLYLNLNYVSFNRDCGDNDGAHRNAVEYAEFILAVFRHLHTKYSIIPDAVEIILEPDNAGSWSGLRIGQAIVATGALLQSNGYTPDFIAPSVAGMHRFAQYVDPMLSVAGVRQYLSELSYHRYQGVTAASFKAVTDRAMQYGLRTAMLEKLAADYHALHQDLMEGLVSAWQQFAIAWRGDGSGGNVLIGIDFTASPPRPFYPERTKFLRQYFRFVRPGAVRIDATSQKASLDPIAFINSNGKYVVVVKANGGGTFGVGDLPAGTYGITYTTASEFDVQPDDVTLSTGQVLAASIPAAGVITVYGK